MRPVGSPFDQAVFDRIYMNIGDMVSKIGLVAHGMLPISVLPNPVFAAGIRRAFEAGCEQFVCAAGF